MKVTDPYFVAEVGISIDEFAAFDSNIKIG
jgi:hypothetical protein